MRIFRKWRNPRQKPPFGAEVDWSDPITEGLVGCFLFNELSGEKIQNLSDYETSLISVGLDWVGDGLDENNNGDELDFSSVFHIPTDVDFTFHVVADIRFWNIYTNPGWWRDGATSQGDTFCIIDGTYLTPWIRLDGINILHPTDGTQLTTGMQAQTFVVRSALDAKWYLNGKLEHQASHTVPVPDIYIYRLGWQYDNTQRIDGRWIYCLFWNRALSDSEIERLYYEPYSFFLAPFPVFMVNLGAVPTYSQTVEGSLSPTGALGFKLTYREEFSGSVGIGGSLSTLLSKVFNGSVSPSGEVTKLSGKVVSGQISPAGDLGYSQGTTVASSGSVGPSGGLAFKVERKRALSGVVSCSGSLTALAKKMLSGAVTPYGVQVNSHEEGEEKDKMIGSRQRGVVP